MRITVQILGHDSGRTVCYKISAKSMIQNECLQERSREAPVVRANERGPSCCHGAADKIESVYSPLVAFSSSQPSPPSPPFLSFLVHNLPIVKVSILIGDASSFQTRYSLHRLAYNHPSLVCPFTALPSSIVVLYLTLPPAFVFLPRDRRKHSLQDVFKTQRDYLWYVPFAHTRNGFKTVLPLPPLPSRLPHLASSL